MKLAYHAEQQNSRHHWNEVIVDHYGRDDAPEWVDQGDGTRQAELRRECALDLLDAHPERYFRPDAEDDESDAEDDESDAEDDESDAEDGGEPSDDESAEPDSSDEADGA